MDFRPDLNNKTVRIRPNNKQPHFDPNNRYCRLPLCMLSVLEILRTVHFLLPALLLRHYQLLLLSPEMSRSGQNRRPDRFHRHNMPGHFHPYNMDSHSHPSNTDSRSHPYNRLAPPALVPFRPHSGQNRRPDRFHQHNTLGRFHPYSMDSHSHLSNTDSRSHPYNRMRQPAFDPH